MLNQPTSPEAFQNLIERISNMNKEIEVDGNKMKLLCNESIKVKHMIHSSSRNLIYFILILIDEIIVNKITLLILSRLEGFLDLFVDNYNPIRCNICRIMTRIVNNNRNVQTWLNYYFNRM